jgi:hypothetical protein
MKAPTHLEIPSEPVTIGEEEFMLREMPAKRLFEYAQVFDAAAAAEKEDPAPTDVDSTDPAFEAWFARSIERGNAPLRFLLGKSDEWIEANMVRSTKDAVLAIQRRLNGAGAAEGNAPSPGASTT